MQTSCREEKNTQNPQVRINPVYPKSTLLRSLLLRPSTGAAVPSKARRLADAMTWRAQPAGR